MDFNVFHGKILMVELLCILCNDNTYTKHANSTQSITQVNLPPWSIYKNHSNPLDKTVYSLILEMQLKGIANDAYLLKELTGFFTHINYTFCFVAVIPPSFLVFHSEGTIQNLKSLNLN